VKDVSLDLGNAQRLNINSGEYVFEEDQKPESFHLMRRGSVELIRQKNVACKIESIESPIGNTDLLLDGTRSFSARATEQTEILFTEMSKKQLRDWLIEHPEKHLEELRNLSSVLDLINDENRHMFGEYRDLREVFETFLKPLRVIYNHEGNKIELSSLMEDLLKDHLEIIDQAGKSGTISVDDLSVADNVKERFTPGEEICSEGEEGTDLYLHLEGSLSVLKDGQLVSSIEKTGLIFGEMAAFLDNKRKASVVAETEATVAVLPVDNLTSLFEKSPKIARKINRMLLKRFEKADVLQSQLTRFEDNLRTLYGNDGRLDNERRKIAELIQSLRGRGSNHEETEQQLDKLEDWVRKDGEQERAKLFDELGGETESAFTDSI
jgi:CRP-like cAMP-binding protein